MTRETSTEYRRGFKDAVLIIESSLPCDKMVTF